MTQLHLPQFTILHGTPQECHDFAHELSRRSVATIVLDFDAPIRDSMVPLFFDGNYLEADLENPSSRMKYLPHFDTVTVFEWIVDQKIMMRDRLGDDVLGKLFVHEYTSQGYEDYHPHAVVCNCDSVADIKPIIEKFGRNSVACVNLGPLTHTNQLILPHVRTYWIAVSEPAKQVDQYLFDRKAEAEHARTA